MSVRAWTALVLMLAMAFCIAAARAEDGYELWLRYHPLAPAQAALYGQ
jgi:alpha-glucuronidase